MNIGDNPAIHAFPSSITVLSLRQRDKDAWAHVYDWLATDLRSFIRRIGAHDVDDILGDTMLHLVRDINSFTGTVAELRPWAFRIARNRVIDAVRRKTRRPMEVSLHDSDTAALTTIELEISHSGDIDLDQLSRALDILTPEQREVLWLRYALDTSLEDTAQIVGSTPDAVASMAYRALSRLRKATP